MRRTWIPGALVLALGLLLTGLVFAGEEYKCTATTQECLDALASYYKDMGWLGIERRWEEATKSLEIVKVVADSPASRAGFLVGDRISAINGLTFTPENEEKLQELQHQRKPGKVFRFTQVRDGKEKVVEVTLGRMPEDIIASQVGAHMLQHVTPPAEGEKTANKDKEGS